MAKPRVIRLKPAWIDPELEKNTIAWVDPSSRLKEAIANQEELSIVYVGGMQCGVKRPVLPMKLFSDCLFAIYPKYGWEQKFLLNKLLIVESDFPVKEYQPLKKGKDDEEDNGDNESTLVRRNLNPSIKFIDGHAEGWAFRVHECFRPALDISLSTVIDKARTHELRLKQLNARGYSCWNDFKLKVTDTAERQKIQKEVLRYKRFRQVWTEAIQDDGSIPAYDFHEGDTIHSIDNKCAIQINSVKPGNLLAVHVFEREGERLKFVREFSCSQVELVSILRYGLTPSPLT